MDYMDFLQKYVQYKGNPVKFMQDLYNQRYDESHGAERYSLSKIPWFSWWKKFQDAQKQAEDQWQNTHTDPAYSTRLNDGFDSSLSNSVGRSVRMASSLSDMYVPEVVENVQKKFNNSIW